MGVVAVAVVWAGTAAGLWWLVRNTARLPRRLLSTPWPAAAAVALVAVFAVVVYPIVDDRRASGGGSDADDAVLVVLDGIAAGAHDPYATTTYLGNPPATGPGSLLWFAPFHSRSTYPWGLVAAFALMLGVVRLCTGGWVVPSLVALLTAVAAPFWEGLAQGSDHLPFACSLVAGAVLVERARRRPLPPALLVAAGAALGALATVRAPYGIVPALLAIALFPSDRRGALALGGAGTATVLVLHGALIARVGWDAYSPIQQLLVKSDEDLGRTGRLVIVAGVLAAAALLVARLRRGPEGRRPVPILLLGVGLPMTSIAVAGLLTARDSSSWSAGSYFLDTLPLAALWLAERVLPLDSDG